MNPSGNGLTNISSNTSYACEGKKIRRKHPPLAQGKKSRAELGAGGAGVYIGTGLLSRFVVETGTKGLPAGRGPFCPGFSHKPGQKPLKNRDKRPRGFRGDVSWPFVPAPDWAGTKGQDERPLFY